MRRLTMLACALGAALLMSSSAFAQVPADPNNPNEAIPDALAQTPYGEPITLENAKKAAAGAVAEMKKRNWQGMDPGKRTLLRVVLVEKEIKPTSRAVERLMGTKAEARFDFIQEKAEFASAELLDV